jgi:hypothetical protein
MFALATPVQATALLAAAAATAYALVTRNRRRRAFAMLAAPVLAVLSIGTLATTVHVPSVGPAILGAAVVGGIAVLVLTWLVHRRPNAFALLAVAALPFRVPVSIGSTTANLLLPLYGVIAAGILREQALKNFCLFYVPFAMLFLLLLDTVWTHKLLRTSLWVTVGLALAFAAIGCVEFATGHLLITNEKVVEANSLLPYFRVNSLFFDPNIFGRYLALTMILLATVLLWTQRSREAGWIAAALVLLWLGLVFSLSQSSFAALLLGLAVLAGLRWKPWPVVAALGGAVLLAAAVVAIAPGLVNIHTSKQNWWNRATSGRGDLVAGGLRMVRDRPLWGFGSGGYANTYRKREHVSSEKVVAASHTIPLTVTAEQGVIGLAAYLALVAISLALMFRGLRARLAPTWPGLSAIALTAMAAAYAALLLHTLVYAAFLEDPLAWVLLAIAAGLRTRAEGSNIVDEPGRRGRTPAVTGA